MGTPPPIGTSPWQGEVQERCFCFLFYTSLFGTLPKAGRLYLAKVRTRKGAFVFFFTPRSSAPNQSQAGSTLLRGGPGKMLLLSFLHLALGTLPNAGSTLFMGGPGIILMFSLLASMFVGTLLISEITGVLSSSFLGAPPFWKEGWPKARVINSCKYPSSNYL